MATAPSISFTPCSVPHSVTRPVWFLRADVPGPQPATAAAAAAAFVGLAMGYYGRPECVFVPRVEFTTIP